jgi:hypothetical protein
MSKKNTDDVPNFKDQCNSRSIVGQEDPFARNVASALPSSPPAGTPSTSKYEGLTYKNTMRSIPLPEDADEPPLDALHPIPEATDPIRPEAIQNSVSVVALAEAVVLRDSQLREEELERQAPPPPQTTTAVGQQHEYVLTCVLPRKNVAIWLVLIAAMAAVAVVGGLWCRTDKCGGTAESPTTQVSPKTLTDRAEDRATAIAAYINNITLLPSTITIAYPPIYETGSVTAVEEKALQWVIEEDPLDLTAASSDQFRLQQRYALLTLWFKMTRNGGVWINSTGWLTAENECDWFGILCIDVGEAQPAVEGITLSLNDIQEGIPVDFGLLRNLKVINLADNWLPEKNGQWRHLKNSDLTANSFSDSLPKSIGQLRSLKNIGPPIYEVGSVTAAEEQALQWLIEEDPLNRTAASSDQFRLLQHAANSFSGLLPKSIGQWSKAEKFDVNSKSYTGSLPKLIDKWSSLDYIDLQADNLLSASCPVELANSLRSHRVAGTNNEDEETDDTAPTCGPICQKICLWGRRNKK